MRSLLVTLATAVLASLFTLWAVDALRIPAVNAQGPSIGSERPRVRSMPLSPKAAASLFDEQGLSPEEVINVAVYDQCNRSVVNISTVSVSREGIFRMAMNAEGGRFRGHHQHRGAHPHELPCH